nr:50S ribosomal protein L30 [uncultured Porphyromonas sp.]
MLFVSKIQLVRSKIMSPKVQKLTLQALGLKKLGQIVEHNDTPQIRGMVNAVKHLVRIVE